MDSIFIAKGQMVAKEIPTCESDLIIKTWRWMMIPRLFPVILILFAACAADGVTEAVVEETDVDDMQTGETEGLLVVIPTNEISSALVDAPSREGPTPETPDGIPHQQHNQNAPVDMQTELQTAVADLPGILLEPTPFSFTGSMGWRLEESFAQGPDEAFIRESREFGHQHVPADGSMHMLLPNQSAKIALDKGWGIIHPLTSSISGENSEYVMIYGPRNADELQTVWIIAQISYYQARGLEMTRSYGVTY